MKHLPICILVLFPTFTTAQSRDLNESSVSTSGAEKITAEIWVDNWFAMSVNGASVLEDSTPYNTERSFNAERATFAVDLPMTVAFEFRDFMENDTGLEYIGSNRQQMGDGGAIAQFMDAGGQVFGATTSDWKCLVVHHAPIKTSCEKANDPQIGVGDCAAKISEAPADWTSATFDDSAWPNATEHSANAVSPKQGYDAISWSSDAALIWGGDLERDNIVLCRAIIDR